MHDGRFNTLEEVIDHYNSGLQNTPALNPALAMTMGTGLMLSDQDKSELVAFLHTLTDQALITGHRCFCCIAFCSTEQVPFDLGTYPIMEYPVDNPENSEVAALGESLFFDPILSIDSSINPFVL